MDAGIIRAFKARYKHLYIHQVINDFDEGIEEPEKIDILQAIRLVKNAWDAISKETIKNCWRHTQILPSRHLTKIFSEDELVVNNNLETQEIQISEIIIAQREAQEIIDLTDNSDIQQLAQEYLNNDEFIITEEVMNDDRIIELINNPDAEDNDDNQVEEEPKITFTEAKQQINILLKFIRQQSLQPDSFIKENDETYLRNLLLRTHRASNKLMKQSTLENFLTNNESNK